MNAGRISESQVSARVRNVGGISEAEVAFEPGVTILAGRNATNRTSLLRAIMLALGSQRASLKGDADEGSVELTVGDRSFTRTLTRHGDDVSLGGDPYLDDAEVADLFAFLLEDNEARQAVPRGRDLREIIMRPIDTDAIQAEIDRLETTRREIDERVDAIDEEERRLPELERRRGSLRDEIEEKREELEAAEETLESLDSSAEETRAEKEELESKLDELQGTRSELDRLRRRIETEKESVESLSTERDELEEQLRDTADPSEIDTTEIEREIETLRERKRTLDGVVGELLNVISFNEEMLEGDRSEIRTALDRADGSNGTPTDQLVGSEVVCWTCGSEVETGQIETTLDTLRSLRQDKLERIRNSDERLSELRAEQESLEDERERRRSLESRLEGVEDELESRSERREELRTERDRVADRLEELEAAVDELESEEFGEVLDQHKEANRIEFEIGRLGTDLEEVVEEIEGIERRIDDRESLEAEREEVTRSLVDARTRIEQIEEQAVEEFNSHIETVLDLLEYGNLDRIWIERIDGEVQDGRRTVERSQFELHLVRTNDSGTAYEDTVDHLSESEREVTGLVFALAGYLVHEVYEELPFIVLDSLEAIDSDRIAALVDYFSDYAHYSVVALLPEDEQALDGSYDRLREF